MTEDQRDSLSDLCKAIYNATSDPILQKRAQKLHCDVNLGMTYSERAMADFLKNHYHPDPRSAN